MFENLLLNIAGAVMSGLAGLMISWISRRSVNYRKIDKYMLVSTLLYFFYINGVLLVITFVGTILIVVFHMDNIMSWPVFYYLLGMTILSVLIFWGWVLRTKRMKKLMDKFRESSRWLFGMIHGYAILSVLINYAYLPYALLEEKNNITKTIEYASYVITIWWVFVIISFLWRTANYIFSEMKITLNDGEVILYTCNPQMCRVHKNYLRLIKRDDKGVITYERHINELVIKQIEYY